MTAYELIEDLKKLTLEKFDIKVEIIPELRDIDDEVIILHFKIPEEYRIFFTPILNECSFYVCSLHLKAGYHCTRW